MNFITAFSKCEMSTLFDKQASSSAAVAENIWIHFFWQLCVYECLRSAAEDAQWMPLDVKSGVTPSLTCLLLSVTHIHTRSSINPICAAHDRKSVDERRPNDNIVLKWIANTDGTHARMQLTDIFTTRPALCPEQDRQSRIQINIRKQPTNRASLWWCSFTVYVSSHVITVTV